MHNYKDNIEAYFIRGNPDLEKTELVEDTIWSKTEESLRPGIINKTLLSLEYLQDRINSFDYVLRTNLSSFYIFDRLLKILETKPKEKISLC